MRRAIRNCVTVAGAALAVLYGSAQALTCYELYDRNDNVVYRDSIPPVDMSDQGAAARAALRQRGEYLMISDAERCLQVAFVFGQAGSANLSVEDFLGRVRPEARTSNASPSRPSGSEPAAQMRGQ